jgi:imidazolonepropionase-like amidohydrolase
VIDVAGGKPPQVASVLISGERIVSIAARINIPKNATLYEGKGKFLIPGLWDSHFHLIRKQTERYTRPVWLPLLLSMGVTSVRDMGSMPEQIVALRKEIREGTVVGPDLYISGMMIDGPPSKPADTMAVAANAEEARAAVDRMAALGVDFIKVQQNLSADSYNAIIKRAREKGLPVAGHTPDSVSVAGIARAGQKTLEHLTGVLVESSSKETELRETVRKGAPSIDFGPMGPAGRLTLDTFDTAKASALFASLRQVAVVPTMAWERAYIHLDETAKRAADEWRWVPDDVRRDAALAAAVKRRRPETDALMKEYYRAAASVLAKMHQAGVTVLAGTDGGDEFTVPGYALHDEMELLVQAGFSPLDALKAATATPARLFGAPAERADLVILSANPLTDIRNTKRVEAVVLRGRLLRKGDAAMMPAAPESMR